MTAILGLVVDKALLPMVGLVCLTVGIVTGIVVGAVHGATHPTAKEATWAR